jgi:replicative DNA helicase
MNIAASIQAPEPICNVETEAGLIAALLMDNRQIDRVADVVSGEDFSDPFFRQVFEIACTERALGNAVHAASLRRALGDDKAKLLATLSAGSGAVLIGAADFAREVRELGRKRRLVEGLEHLAMSARLIGEGHETTADELTSDVETVLAENTNHDDSIQQLSAADCIRKVVDSFGDHEPGIRSGIGSLDSSLGAIRKRNLVIMGGRPGMGKSAVASSYALGAASKGHGVLFISLEMSAEEIGERMAADLCFDGELQVPYSAITDWAVNAQQAREVARAADRINDLPLTVVDMGGGTLGRVNALVRRYKRRYEARHKKLELVIVDYLQLLSPDTREKDLYTRVSEVSKGLKTLAKTQDVAVLALCQLSRKVEERKDRRPQISDLRDSGQIEQDADAIVFLYAPEYYLLQEEPSAERDSALDEVKGKLEFIVAKRRRGAAGVGEGRFYRAFQAVRG